MNRIQFLGIAVFNIAFLSINYRLFSYQAEENNSQPKAFDVPETFIQNTIDHDGIQNVNTGDIIVQSSQVGEIINQKGPQPNKIHRNYTHIRRIRGVVIPLSDIYQPFPDKEVRSFSHYDPLYEVPSIEPTTLVNCPALLNGDPFELDKADKINLTKPKVPIYEETYLNWTQDCEKFKQDRGYILKPLSEEEENYPLAFSIATYTDFEQTERLIRMIYQPQNFYCIHIDTKAPLLFHRTVQAYTRCFHNVWIASHLDKIKWGDVSVLLPAINCMRDMVKYQRGKWKYFINLTGQEMPLRTNWEMVQIAKIFNGSNDIGGSIPRMDMERVNFKWTHRWSKTYQQTIFYNTYVPKPPFYMNLTFFKGELHGFFSHRMLEYIVEDPVSKDYLKWCWDSGHPTEHYWNVLNYNTQLKAPGGYQGPLDLADEYSYHLMVRVKNWVGFYGDRECMGKSIRGICVFGTRDVPWLATRNELAANKFHLTYQFIGYDCLEERHRNRTKMRDKVPFNREYYKNLPTVIYGRKDGL